MSNAVWCVMPILAGPAMTEAAIGDLLAQSLPTKLLLINQGVEDSFRDRLERLAEQEAERIFLWSHQPPLPSLSASWNHALDYVWSLGEEVAFVVNNDVRLHPDTVERLAWHLEDASALFVSAVGVTPEQFEAARTTELTLDQRCARGGPDFSCYLIAKACHDRFRFDERFVPAFCEDLDYHRRLMLAGEGQRIFSVNLPYLHLASQTLKALPDAEAGRIRQQIERGSRAYYAQKWGGPVNAETFPEPFGPTNATGASVTTPALFDKERAQWAPPAAEEIF